METQILFPGKYKKILQYVVCLKFYPAYYALY